MHKTRQTAGIVLMAVLVLSACGRDSDPILMNITDNQRGPDEFSVLPTKPLQAPQDYVSLPTPTPGGTNLTDPTPRADAVAALGGRPETVTRDGVISGDGGLLAHATRYGTDSGIRQTLSAEDLEFRRNNRGLLLERWFNVNVYFKAYEDQALDQHAELARFRRLGVRTPSAPPDPSVYDSE